jgi:hypothetical protein
MKPLHRQISEYFGGFFEGVQDHMPEKLQLIGLRFMVEFSAYIDAAARSNPSQFHHVYEWGMVGEEAGRLFEMQMYPTGNSLVITYVFLPSVVPNENGVVFTEKATIMEEGRPVTFETDKAVPIGDGEFRTGSFTFIPGGEDVNGAFRKAFISYFTARPQIEQKNVTIRPSGISRISGYNDARRII